MPEPKETITLYCQKGGSDKFYTACIIEEDGGFTVPINYGRRGTSGQSGSKTNEPVSYEKAKAIYDKIIKEKMGKGYTPGEGMSPMAGNVIEKIDSGLFPQLLDEITEDELEKYLRDDNFGAQEKKDGQRKFLKHGEGNTTSINKKGFEVGYASVFKTACEAYNEAGKDNFTFDGEEIGETLHIFDARCLNGEKLDSFPYIERYRKLEQFIITDTGNEAIRLLPLATGYEAKKALYDKLVKEEREGIIFKRLNAPYTEGRSSDQVKLKFYATASIIVIRINEKRSIGMGIIENDKVIEIGNCTIPPNKGIPEVGKISEVKYLYAYKGGSLYQPTYLDVRDDVDKEECVISQLKYKAEED